MVVKRKKNMKERSVNVDKGIIRPDGVSSSSAKDRAEDILKLLKSPSFFKEMLRSHVTVGFWLGLPKKFCVAHLPKHNKEVMLVVENDDEEEEEYSTTYLAYKNGLSGGWAGFSIKHKLAEGDVCVFQLIKQCKFKVHIVRARALPEEVSNAGALIGELNDANSLSVVNAAARSLVNLHADPIEAVKMDEDREDQQEKNGGVSDIMPLQSLQQLALKHKTKKRKLTTINNNKSDDNEKSVPRITRSHGPSVVSKSPLDFKDVKTFNDFKIRVNGLIPTHLRRKYYQLCCSQKRFLHENLMEGLNGELASGMISETVTISDAIQAAKPRMGLGDLERYDKTLKSFEDLGMVVGFLRARIYKLSSLSRKLEEKIESKKNDRKEAAELIEGLEKRLLAVEKLKMKLDVDIGGLTKNSNEALEFTQIAGEPW